MKNAKEEKSDDSSSEEDEESLKELKRAAVLSIKNAGPKRIKQKGSLEELCTVNGVKFDKLQKGAGKNVTSLEMFFSGFPKIIGMEYFPSLQSLTLMGQAITELENLEHLPNLTELCVSECKLSKISGLTECKKLKKLLLYDNKISKMENISHLDQLGVLWLNNNCISEIEGLEGLLCLLDLNLAGNSITQIGNSLNETLNLKTLDLSANQIASLKDLTNLSQLPCLESLSFKDPIYGPNPVALLCNYSTHLLFHLPHLRRIDSCSVENSTLKELAETTVSKKKMYYNMRVKTLQRNKSDLMCRLETEKAALQSNAKKRMQKLYSAVKDIEREVEEDPESPSFKENKNPISSVTGDKEENKTKEEDLATIAANAVMYSEKLQQKKEALLKRIAKLQKECYEIDKCHQESCEQVNNVSESTVQRLLLELETGGNVRFEDGKPTDPWYKSCQELVLSRFCVDDYMGCGISGIKIHRITRVHNRILRMRFDNKLDEIMEREDINELTKGRSYKRLLEYLFFMWDPSLLDGNSEPIRVLEEGFRPALAYESLNEDGGVPLANSVSIADGPRMSYLKTKAKQRSSTDRCPFRHGQLIVSKVFVGNAAPVKSENKIKREIYRGADSVFRTRKHENCPKRSGSTVKRTLVDSDCDCSARQCAWYVFDHVMVLPEYVVDFEYITKVKPKSTFIYYYGDNDSDEKQDETSDEDVLNMEPAISPRPRFIALTEELLLKKSKAESLELITVLNLHGNGLSRLQHVACMTSLKKLTVCFNELTRLDEISHMIFLEYLDASFNKITSLEGLKGCSRLKHLDVSWNQLRNTREELGILRKHVISLTNLDTRNNPWQKLETLRLRALGRLKNLEWFDGIHVSDEEMTVALKLAAASRPSSFSILAHARTDQDKPRTLSLVPTAQSILANSQNKPVKLVEDDSQWFVKVTTVNLDNQRLGKIANMEQLVNLKWASFNNNDLTKIEGLDSCVHLEELSIENNCISKFDGLSKLFKLQWLSLSGNNLATLDTGVLEKLSDLKYLSVENNCLKYLRGLQNSINLQELYLGNNQLSNIREIFNLKPIPNLLILDLCGNPLASADQHYRLFVVYHMTSLKALDGIAVETSEGSQAKDLFGGRLTSDFIAERLGHSNFSEVRELDLPHSSLRTVDLGTSDLFFNLRSVNLEHNSLTSFGGLVNLLSLKVLCLNHNHIESVVAKPKVTSPVSAPKRGGDVALTTEITNPENLTPLLPNLEVLHLGYNGITSMNALQLSRLTGLRALFLQGNEISKVEGLEGLISLRELVLDRNKIKSISSSSFASQWNIIELHMEENRIRELKNMESLQSLQRLYLGMNRIQDLAELERLESLKRLVELSVINNAVTRRLLHRPLLVYRMPNLLCIDGIPVTTEEKTKAELYFIEQQSAMQSMATSLEPSLPGIVTTRAHAPLRVTTVQLNNNTEHIWGGNALRNDFSNGTLLWTLEQQQDKGRRRVSNARGTSTHSHQTLPTSDSTHSLPEHRYGHSSVGLNQQQSGVISRQPQGSSSVPYIAHGNYSLQNANGDATDTKGRQK
ncbi:leucine-rich repeat-containing protein 9-like isoform X1 [Acropora millepora]|uniref:leucine-rich repeat-containing protein 9-like isoform X1 n=1 Tax=Acropora millepora TaxID=45264 RepID=UPI001CF26AAB|nr:leucine-rich repeat-containing protein 9-like isoform X1 [Acropora millepora]